MWDWLLHITGADDGSGAWYSFWSGFGADLGELAILGAAVGVYRKHNCHVHRCWRIAKQEVIGTSWKVCHRHHPVGRPTEQDVREHFEAWQADRDARSTVVQAVEHAVEERDPSAIDDATSASGADRDRE